MDSLSPILISSKLSIILLSSVLIVIMVGIFFTIKSLSAKQFQNVSPVKEKIKIPQADKVEKIIQFPPRISEGYDTSEKMVGVFGFTIRQSSYYRHAAEILGLVRNDRYKYTLTDKGEEYLKLPVEKKSSFICKLILEFPNNSFYDILVYLSLI